MGTIVETPCPTCGGIGRERRTKRFTVKIPAGVRDGTRIKLRGKGEAGYGGASAGDLYVVTRVEPSEIYERRGDDLVVQVPVSYPTAALGGNVEVPTPDGRRLAEGAVGVGGREAAPDQGTRRTAAEGLRQGRRARAAPHPGAEASQQAGARAPRRAPEDEWLMDDRPRYMISVAAEMVGMHPQTLADLRAEGPRAAEAHRRQHAALLGRRCRAAAADSAADHGGRPQSRGRRARAAARGRARAACVAGSSAWRRRCGAPSTTCTAPIGARSSSTARHNHR